MSNDTDFEAFLNSYLGCALWSSTDNSDDSGGEPLDRNYTIDDFSPEMMAKCVKDCQKFIDDNRADLDEVSDTYHVDYSQHGHDFWLTRNEHGVGFWDRGYDELGNTLSAASNVFGPVHIWEGEDGKLYFY